MRIVAGLHRGRRIEPPPGKAVRPTAARIREAAFNLLAHREDGNLLPEARVLDLCCGTGAMGLEALSRGAARACFVDRSAESLRLTRQNARALGEESRSDFLRRDVGQLGAPPVGAPYTLAFLDPPYRQGLLPQALMQLVEHGWLAGGAWLVVESEKKATLTPDALQHYRLVRERVYGNTALRLLRVEVVCKHEINPL